MFCFMDMFLKKLLPCVCQCGKFTSHTLSFLYIALVILLYGNKHIPHNLYIIVLSQLRCPRRPSTEMTVMIFLLNS